MGTQSTGEILLELITVADELPRVVPQATEIQDLLKQLTRAAKAERSTAAKLVGDLESECDGVNQQLEDVRKQLCMAKDQIEMLRNEVCRLGEGIKKPSMKENVSITDGSNVVKKAANSDTDRAIRTAGANSAASNTPKDPSNEPYAPPSTLRSRPSEANRDPRRISTSFASTDVDPLRHPPPQAVRRSDSYCPVRAGPVVGSSPKRKRKSSPPSTATRSAATDDSKFYRHTPVCGTCSYHGVPPACDGAAFCGRCESIGHRKCAYELCVEDKDCRRTGCDHLHSGQWDEDVEPQRRMVRRYGR